MLLDIDLTLLRTSRAGMDTIVRAGRELFGPSFTNHGVDYAGRLDPLIFTDLLQRNAIAPTERTIAALRARYTELFAELIEQDPSRIQPMPGAHELVDVGETLEGCTLGLMTGNFEGSGVLKLRAAGFEPDRFAVRVWGDESPYDPPAREHLPPVAMARYERAIGRGIDGSSVVVVGDTVHDVACAQANGCWCIAVATGAYDEDALRDAGADLVLPDLRDTGEILRWITTNVRPAS